MVQILLKGQKLEIELCSKYKDIARMREDIRKLNDLLHMDPAQQMSALVLRKV